MEGLTKQPPLLLQNPTDVETLTLFSNIMRSKGGKAKRCKEIYLNMQIHIRPSLQP